MHNCQLVIFFAIVISLINCLDVRIGFLTKHGGRARLRSDRRENELRDVLYYGVSKINKTSLDNLAEPLNYHIHLASTEGKESESIKKTIDLITKHQVNVIIGPHKTCQIEASLASIYNVAMLSYLCPLPATQQSSDSNNYNHLIQQQPKTFIQTKPPYWKIVQKVVTLVGHLLERAHCYPNHLVLLYFKDPTIYSSSSPVDSRPLLDSVQLPRNGRQTTDAIQYKLIGELLQAHLREVFLAGGESSSSAATTINDDYNADAPSVDYNNLGGPTLFADRKRPLAKQLSVLNWNTTYHHGYTKNPFRKVVRRHLYRQRQQRLANQSASVRPGADGGLKTSLSEMAAIYIIVGNHDQHLGLMLALDELNLLGQNLIYQSSQQRVPISRANRSANGGGSAAQRESLRQQSLVIGVDIEPFDERADSVQFLRGLLDGSQPVDAPTGTHLGGNAANFDPLASKYSNYLGVVPSKPTHTDELQEGISRSRKLTYVKETMSHNLAAAMQQLNNSNLTVESLLPVADLSKLIRLPIEAFYLYDSVLLIGSYFSECLQTLKLSKSECSNGTRVFDWFTNRTYFSSLNHNTTKFDSQAQTDGFYTIITRRLGSGNSSDDFNEMDDFGIIQIGSFVESDIIELRVGPNEISPIWLPLWCKLKTKSQLNQSATGPVECQSFDCNRFAPMEGEEPNEMSPSGNQTSFRSSWGITIAFGLFAMICCLLLWALHDPQASETYLQHSYPNVGWFDEADEQNFCQIVSDLLLTPQINEDDGETETTFLVEKNVDLLDLHCYMFPFPSCKFVHWLIALHQLKEMMFKFQTSNHHESTRSDERGGIRGWFTSLSLRNGYISKRAVVDSRAFFLTKHGGSGTLRLLLHKYKTINECLCTLSQLNQASIVRLFGATLMCNVNGTGGKKARLIVESTGRGNLREALKASAQTLSDGAVPPDKIGAGNNVWPAPMTEKARCEFNQLLLLSLLNDLLDGLDYLHHSKLQFHGELRATTCMVTLDWRLKLSGFQAHHMRRSLGEYEQKLIDGTTELYMNDLIYSAPEILISHNRRATFTSGAMQLADIYSFAFILYELLVGHEPWECLTKVTSSKMLVERVKVERGFRPPLSQLDKRQQQQHQESFKRDQLGANMDNIKQTLGSCWSHLPELRPQSIKILRAKLTSSIWWQTSSSAKLPSITTATTIIPQVNLIGMYARMLENISISRSEELLKERLKSFKLEHALLPESLAAKLNINQSIPASAHYDSVSFCLFRFILMPTSQAQDSTICHINGILARVDHLISNYRHNIHLIDSQVDSSLRFLAFSGGPLTELENSQPYQRQTYHHSALLASFALQLVELTNRWQVDNPESYLQVRCALHCGPASGGLLSLTCRAPASCLKLSRYILYGASLQLIDILETTGLPQRIQISTDFRTQLLDGNRILPMRLNDISGGSQDYVMVRRESKLQVRSLGELEAYWLLNGPRLSEGQGLMLLSP